MFKEVIVKVQQEILGDLRKKHNIKELAVKCCNHLINFAKQYPFKKETELLFSELDRHYQDYYQDNFEVTIHLLVDELKKQGFTVSTKIIVIEYKYQEATIFVSW